MTTAVRGCGQLVTMDGPNRPRIGPEMRDLAIIENGAFAFDETGITWVGKSEDLPAQVDHIIEAEGRLVTPGLIDAHTHAVFAGTRANEFELRSQGSTYQEIKEAGGGILSTVRATRAASEQDLAQLGSQKLQWMLRNGTTTVEIKSGYGLDLETELKMLRIASGLGPQRVRTTFLGAHAVPPEATSRESYVEQVVEQMLPAASEYAQYCDIFVERGYFEPEDARRIAATAQRFGLGFKLHADQFTPGNFGSKLAAELHAKTVDHLEQTDIEGIHALFEGGITPVLLPASVYCLGLRKYPEARTMIDEGLPVVLATDFNPGSSPSPSLPFAMSLASAQMRMTPAESLVACTVNAAYALDLGSEIGSLTPGKAADFVLWDATDYRELPYWAGREMARSVFIGGQSVLS